MTLSTLKYSKAIDFLLQEKLVVLREKENTRPLPIPSGFYQQKYRHIATYIIEITDQLNLATVTTCRVFALMARALADRRLNTPEQEPYIQMVVLVCVNIAAKYEETSYNQPTTNELLDAADNLYTLKDFLLMERFVLNLLQWQVGDITPACFGGLYLEHSTMGNDQMDERVKTDFVLLLGLSLQDQVLLKFRPSVISASALMLARAVAKQHEGGGIVDVWDEDMVALTGYTTADLRLCTGRLWQHYLPFTQAAACSFSA